MRILHINNNYSSTKLHQTMMEYLSNVENDVYCPICEGITVNVGESDKAVISKCFSRIDRFFYFIKQKKIFNDLLKKYNINSYNCVHAYTLFTDGGIANKIYKKSGIPFIVAVRATDFNMLKFKPYLKHQMFSILKNASKILFLSSTIRDSFFEIIGHSNENLLQKTRVIPNGVDDFWINNSSIHEKSKDCIKAICVGKVDKNKNTITVCKALQLLKVKQYNVSFEIIGKVLDKNIVKKLKKYDFVIRKDFMSKEQLINEYALNDIYVMASHSETFGLVYVEAMSQGLPVIYTQNQGFDGQFKEGIVGYHVDSKNPKDVMEKILEAYKNYEVLSQNCVKNYKKYNWISITNEYLNIYDEIKMSEV